MRIILSIVVIAYLLTLYFAINNLSINKFFPIYVNAQEEQNDKNSTKTDNTIIVAVIAAIASIIAAIFSAAYSAKSQRRLSEFQMEKQNTYAEEQAKREYRYNALKQLYEKCEPVLFQYIELSEHALDTIYYIINYIKEKKPTDNLIDDHNIKYIYYNLLAPLAAFKIL